ncbi:MAG TPA: hypothetical protein PL110_01205 [Candidatus Eremiobacteraeota bacterium]|nr:MAG: hypothetical protein BWY64_03308 [bacterium ADurb.Bin363]HPZ06704.1 hypothetical protein [Candidatus Eremiobacteraeota bacterium]
MPSATPSPVYTCTPLPTITPTPSDITYLPDAKDAVDALMALSSVVKVGISYRDYPARLADTKIKVDKFLRDHPTDYIPGLRSQIESAMLTYEDTRVSTKSNVRKILSNYLPVTSM